MAHIDIPSNFPGMMGLVKYRPDTGKLLLELAETLLRGDSPLSLEERELIAAYVSYRNECDFCTGVHGAVAKQLFKNNSNVVDAVYQNFESANITDKLKALLKIAAKVQLDGKQVSEDNIQRAKNLGATDREIHDTVLIAAAFSMLNRYIDGLAVTIPNDPGAYEQIACQIVESGYGGVLT
ncbi:carboxymuconolactone decarboxylase family protein [Hydrocoleum sp. CS-953]|uniref:carboxymuconolactone decarboxylase family protein n=1 Tax=Microcoleaceae TaxID=1892252 RepID=UPI000B9AA805|nr:peroxidase-related enzyme [Hydrocoleum sp. CS-953]OZH54339.1 carboxymuconolactone decarboxylase [Hydrocoleum sp. CS-953]